MGGELAQGREWSEQSSLDWAGADPGLCSLIRDLNTLYRELPSLWADDFRWLHEDASRNVVAFERGPLVCVANFSGVHQDVWLPSAVGRREILNTDATCYGGTGAGNLGVVATSSIHIGPHAVIWLVGGEYGSAEG